MVEHTGVFNKEMPKMNRFFQIVVLLAGLTAGVAMGQEPAEAQPAKEPAVKGDAAKQVAEQVKQDVVLRALVDELARNKDGLKWEDMQRPYFIEYGLVDMAG